MAVDIVCVGAGVASLAATLRLLKRVRQSSGKVPHVVVLEKGAFVGAHVLSGAMIDPEPLEDLLDEGERRAMPVESVVRVDGVCRLTPRHALRLPWVPPLMRARGFPLVSLTKFTQYLAKLCEAAGAEIYTGFAAVELLRDSGRVTGVRVGDKGVDRRGQVHGVCLFPVGEELPQCLFDKVRGGTSCAFHGCRDLFQGVVRQEDFQFGHLFPVSHTLSCPRYPLARDHP